MLKEYEFFAPIKKNTDSSGGSYIEFPYSVEDCFGRHGLIKVLCWFDTIEYRGSLVKMGTECHIIGVRKEILQKLNKSAGDLLQVRVREDLEERSIVAHPLLIEALIKDSLAQKAYDKFSFTRKAECNRSLESAKTEKTRIKRLDAILEMLRK